MFKLIEYPKKVFQKNSLNLNEIMININQTENYQKKKSFEKNDILIEEKILKEHPRPISLKQTEKIIEQLKKSICQICLENGEKGTGSFMKIRFPNNDHLLPVLVTCNHLVDEHSLKEKEISIKLNGEMKYIELENRIIYTNNQYDITIIEIKENKDEIKDFLALDEDNQNVSISGETIYMLQYFNSQPCVSYGILKNRDKLTDKFTHFCCSDFGSSGSPLLNLTNNQVIGIHIGSSKENEYNAGIFLNNPINDFIKKIYYSKYEEITALTNQEIKKIHIDYIDIDLENYNNYIKKKSKNNSNENNLNQITKKKAVENSEIK